MQLLNNVVKYYKRFTTNIVLALPYVFDAVISDQLIMYLPDQMMQYWWIVILIANLYMNRRKKEVQW